MRIRHICICTSQAAAGGRMPVGRGRRLRGRPLWHHRMEGAVGLAALQTGHQL